MNAALETMLSRYKPGTSEEYLRALREILQHLSLLGLWRADFFDHASFYGGTALRMFYGLPRYSEDLDFSLVKLDDSFSLGRYIRCVAAELDAAGFNVTVDFKGVREKSGIESAFIKADTLKGMLHIQAPEKIVERIHRDARLKLKIEIDTEPPEFAVHEVQNMLIPIPFQVRLYSKPSLFAGKIHALLCRSWKSRIKGRDFYDFLWFVGMNIPCDIRHLKARMVQSGHFNQVEILDIVRLVALLKKRFSAIDFKMAARDVFPFIVDSRSLDLWSEDLFSETAEKIQVVNED
jgi:hypothetical protein